MWKHYLVGIVISLVAGWFFLRVVNLQEMGQTLASMDPIYLIPATALYIISYIFRSMRWHYLMLPVASVRFRPLFASLLIGFLGNNILPAHLGEFVRAFVLGRTEGVSKSATFATIVLERVYDGLTVLFLLLVVLLFMDLPAESNGSAITLNSLRAAGWAGLALFAGLMIFLQFCRWQRERALALCRFLCRPLPERITVKIIEALDAFVDGLALTRARDLGFIILHSLLTWVCLGLWAWSLFPAFGLHLNPMAGILMEVVVALALLIPAAPAFVGTFHLAAAATLGFMGAPAGVAGGYAMTLWLIHFVTTTLLGLYYLWRLGLGWRTISAASSEEP